uniref:Fatty-acid and retinol-binding protein 1 n=1 Tax=Steinernema glaseri TaxID=37863 RepID=A0A1I7Z961_9BILA
MITWTGSTAPAAAILAGLLALIAAPGAYASQLGLDLGSAAATQIFAQALRHTLKNPLPFVFRLNPYSMHGKENDDLASFHVDNKIAYSNVSIEFRQRVLRLNFDNFKMHTDTVVTADLWPVLFDRQLIQTKLESRRVSLELTINSSHVDVTDCAIEETDFVINSDHSSIFEMTMVLATPFIKPYIGSMVCPVVKKAVVNAHYNTIQELPYDSILPPKIGDVVVNSNSSLFYQLDLIQLREKHMCMDVQMSWDELTLGDSVASTLDDFSYCSMKDSEDDRVTVWMDDALANSVFEQIKWDFQWMEEKIPVSSEQLPQSSRDFFSTLCSNCYFFLRVWANGRPVLTAVNSSIVAEIDERINLTIVNPDTNKSTVVVSFTIKLIAQLKPTFDDTTLRTRLELVDTEIKMEQGAFPASFAAFVQDLVKGMLMDVIWPELKRSVEDITYDQGLPISKWCGVDPNGIQALIDDSKFGLSARLTLKNLVPEQCAQDMKANLPKMNKLLNVITDQKLRRRRR